MGLSAWVLNRESTSVTFFLFFNSIVQRKFVDKRMVIQDGTTYKIPASYVT